jgi:acyl-CoA reductase-like NAD-dependent aldehyde dehydrogenase
MYLAAVGPFMTDISVTNPLSGQVLYHLSEPSPEELQQVWQQARSAQERVAGLSVNQRANAVIRLQHVIHDQKEQILDRIVNETGKSRFDALSSEIFGCLDACEHLARIAPTALADQQAHTPLVLMGKKSQIWFEPLGTVLVIAPWNYPFYQILVPALSAFLAGNAVLLKPSELTPLKGLIEDLLKAADFPEHALQVVYGGKTTGQTLVEARPELIFFTGSVASGKKIMATAAQNLTPVVLELGGKDPMLVFEDVNLERTVNGALWGALTTAGQSCTSVERLYVHQSLYKRCVELLKNKMEKLRAVSQVGEPAEIGNMTAPFQLETIEAQLAEAVAEGAQILCGGQREQGSMYFPPTLVVDVNHGMKLMREETFGPVLAVMAFETEAEAIALANDSPYGLSASVWSADLARAERVARQLKVGNVSINNVMLTEANPALPFGGIKASGFGRYKGVWGLETFCNLKSVLIDSQNGKIEANWFPYTPERYRLFSQLTAALFSAQKSLLKTLLTGLKLESQAQKEKL